MYQKIELQQAQYLANPVINNNPNKSETKKNE